MALIDRVVAICQEYAPLGWGDLLAEFGIDITLIDPAALRAELIAERDFPLAARRIPGFEDFALEARRGITPGVPSLSLLYHAFASPNVLVRANGQPLDRFPTLENLEVLENYVWGIEPRSLQDILSRSAPGPFTVSVFALEYRPGIATSHQRHADLTVSRTGVARVGTADSLYDRKARGYVAYRSGDDHHAIRRIPCRYAAFIAVKRKGDALAHGPARFNEGQRFGARVPNDAQSDFWLPVQKLFHGDECVKDQDIRVFLSSNHINEKIRRVHLEDAGIPGFESGHGPPETDESPFQFTSGIAELAGGAVPGLLEPAPNTALVAPAEFEGRPLTLRVPRHKPDSLSPSLTISPRFGDFRSAPEYVHVRRRIQQNGVTRDLGDSKDVVRAATRGNYRAQHFIDFAGDGWIDAEIEGLQSAVLRAQPAYSLVTAPDFYPNVDQRTVIDWWENQIPAELRDKIWKAPPPTTLSDIRLAANVQLEADFDAQDTTMTCIMSPTLPPGQSHRELATLSELKTMRSGSLPDSAAGVFQPGWDVSQDVLVRDLEDPIAHLAAYGLGSPFPEDAKLCAAISTFWPAAAPDSSRQYAPSTSGVRGFATVCPMTDDEVGLGAFPSWDGVPGPKIVSVGGRDTVEYNRFPYVDYVDNAIKGLFSLALTSQIDFKEYTGRIVAMNRAFQSLGVVDRASWGVLSFRKVSTGDTELGAAQSQSGVNLLGSIYTFEIYEGGTHQVLDSNHRKTRVEIRRRSGTLQRFELFVGSGRTVIKRRSGDRWRPDQVAL